jgi:hypothetical protein
VSAFWSALAAARADGVASGADAPEDAGAAGALCALAAGAAPEWPLLPARAADGTRYLLAAPLFAAALLREPAAPPQSPADRGFSLALRLGALALDDALLPAEPLALFPRVTAATVRAAPACKRR